MIIQNFCQVQKSVEIQPCNRNKAEDKREKFRLGEFIGFEQHRKEEHYENSHLFNRHNDGRRVVDKAERFKHIKNRFQNADGNRQKIKAVPPMRIGGVLFIIVCAFERKPAEIRNCHHIIADIERDFICTVCRRNFDDVSGDHIKQHGADCQHNPDWFDFLKRGGFAVERIEVKQRNRKHKQHKQP